MSFILLSLPLISADVWILGVRAGSVTLITPFERLLLLPQISQILGSKEKTFIFQESLVVMVKLTGRVMVQRVP